MKNFVIIYHFNKPEDKENLQKDLKKQFPEHREENIDAIAYFGFMAKEQAAVEDKIKSLLNYFSIGAKDFVALYYTRPDHPDQIQRSMVLGHDDLVETHIKRREKEQHEIQLTDLLEYPFLEEYQARIGGGQS